MKGQQMDRKSSKSGQIIPPELAVKAMRDSGYRNTAYALAELIDNSIQAKASFVELICEEKQQIVKSRTRRRIRAIGVLDNGTGMSPQTLRVALQFGNGTHLADRKGIGRFGMGLPNSSISQCRKVEVWTWQNGPDNAMYTFLDVDQIEKGKMYEVPIPKNRALPKKWQNRSDNIGTSGTLVLWTKFDHHRLSWRGAKTILRHTETFVGRMYRKFIDEGLVSIRMLALDEDIRASNLDSRVRVNDPLYLMCNSSTPDPFQNEPMFQSWGENDEEFKIIYNDSEHKVLVRISWARPETVSKDGGERGQKPYGKHAAENIGVSVVREGRELCLDPSWAINYDPRERWWGVEVDFPSTLDEVFGVTNTKQNATVFAEMASFDWETEADSGESFSEFIDRIQDEGDPRALLVPIVDYIKSQLIQLRDRIKSQQKGTRKKENRYDESTVEDTATSKFKKRAEEGHSVETDNENFTEKDREKFEQELTDDKDYPEDVAKEIANAVIDRNRKVVFLTKSMDGYAFFNVEHNHGGLTSVVFNTRHPFYKQLLEILEPDIEDLADVDLVERIHRATDTVELIFAAWARYEMEEVRQQELLFETRQEWGKMARFFLSDALEDGQNGV